MCGIAGWLGPLQDGKNYAEGMAQALQHRGPDLQGVQLWPEAALVHTRLSILDLSPAGAQPMANEDRTVWIVFNGEIYNHRELRRDLEGRGHVFKGHSDAEVLPHLYEEEGLSFVAKLRGMFAIAIYDMRIHTVTLARDRFGIKPLFYSPGRDRLAFASEINALLKLPGIDTQPDRQAIYDFAALLYIPAPETVYTGIRALQPGEILEARFDAQGILYKTDIYHQWKISPNLGMTLDQAEARTEELITTAVSRQMETDVPLGALLSGGIDSSLVSVAAQEVLNGGLRTFNVRFSEKEYDETWAAMSVAEHIGSRHQTLNMDSVRGTWDHITGLLQHAGQPFADTSFFAVNGVCQLMRRHVTVALSGDGGDEGFGGYDSHWRLATLLRLQRFPLPVWAAAAVAVSPLARFGLVRSSLPRRIRDFSSGEDTNIIQNMFCWLREEEHQNFCKDTHLLPVRRLFESKWAHHLPPEASRLERLSAHLTEIYGRLTLPNDFLFKVDMASMKESLEVRVPMLDEDLFAFGLSLPHNLKVKGRMCKRVLRGVANRRLPAQVANKPKRGFGIPVDTWVDADFKMQLREVLLGPSSLLSEFFRPEVYRPMIEAFCEGRSHYGISRQGLYQRAIMLLSVQLAICGK